MKHFDYIPELDGPQSYVAAGGRTILCKGGGGGGQSAPYYANMDRLYGVQSQAAEYMLNNSMPYIPGYMDNSAKMVGEAMDGKLANQMRQRAGNEATATMSAALAASDRNMQRYGMNFSADRLLSESNRNAIMGAAGKAGAMNDAAARAEDLKWNRNAGALGQATGMGTGAMESVGSAARGYGAAAGNMMQYDALNSAGYGKFGAALAANAFKDGGSVKKHQADTKPGLHLAAGGATPSSNPWTAWKNNNPIQTSQPSGGGGGLSDAVGAVALGSAPILMGKGVKAGLSSIKEAMTPVKDGMGTLSNITEASRNKLTEQGLENAKNFWPTDPNTPVSAASSAATEAGKDVATNVASNATADLATVTPTATGDIVNGAATTANALGESAAAAGTAEAAAGAGAGAGTTLGTVASTALPVLGAGVAVYGIGSALGWWADGGPVERKNMKPGGEVSGKGTETSDEIPAWLSDGEYVLNAEAVKMVGKEKLDQINNAGLIKRGDKPGLELARGGKVGCKMASGGFTGIALGAGVDEFNKQRILSMEQGRYDVDMKLKKPQLDTLDEKTESDRAILKLNTKRNQIGLENADKDAEVYRKQNQIKGIGLDNALAGYGAQSLADGNKERGIQIMNESLAAMPGYNGVKVVDVQPTKDSSGVNYIMSDNSTKFVPAAELQRAIGSMKQGDYQFIHDSAGNVYSGNKATGAVTQAVKSDPAQAKTQNQTAEERNVNWLMTNVPRYKNNPEAAWDAARAVRGKTRTDFILDYVSKNSGLGADVNKLTQDAGTVYDTLRKSESAAATSDIPGSSQTGTGKSGNMWKDWVKDWIAPPQ